MNTQSGKSKENKRRISKQRELGDYVRCNICNTTLKSLRSLKSHLKLIHDGQNIRIKCQICFNGFKSSTALNIHMKNLHEVNAKDPIKCNLCEFAFTRKRGLRRHQISKHSGGSTKKCEICEQEFSVGHFKKHFEKEHEGNQKVKPKVPIEELICKVCEKSYSDKISLVRHIDRQHSNQHKLFKCISCEKEFKAKSYLDRHVKSVHERNLDFKCNLCDKMFNRNDQLKMHKSRMHNDSENTFKCDFCKKSFALEGLWNIHVKRSHTEAEVECVPCGKFFSTRYYYEKHVNSVHKEVTILKCEMCKKSFNDISRLNVHVKIHENKPRVACEICKKTLSTEKCLMLHIKNVHGTEKLQCKYCSKFYSTNTILKKHISAVHYKKKKYNCKPCGKSFITWSGMNYHLKSKTHSKMI